MDPRTTLRATPLSFDVSFLEYPCGPTDFILPETRVPELHDSCCNVGLYLFHFTHKDVQDERWRATPLYFNVFFLENPTE